MRQIGSLPILSSLHRRVGPALCAQPQRRLLIAEHICTYGQDGIRADRKAAILGYGMPLPEALELEAELCYQPAVASEAMTGMARFVKGSRPEPPRPVHVKAA